MSNPTELPDLDRLRQIGELISTQDNRYTDQPMFIVQQRRRVYGFDTDYCENVIWLCSEDDYSEASAEEAAKLEAEYQESGRVKSGWQRTGYTDQWEFVTACFTEQGCKDYLQRDGHNLKEPRIYAEGSYRNEEFRAVRNALIALARRAQPEGMVEQIAAVLMYMDDNGVIAWRGTGDDEEDAIDEADAKARTASEVAKAVEALRAQPEGEAPAPEVPDFYRKVLSMPEGPGVIGPAAQQAAAPGSLDLMNADEMAALRRFDETCQDGEGYDVPKTMMQRLAAIGVVRRTSGSYYETTEFGLRVLDQPAPSAPGTPEAPVDAMAQFAAWKGYELPALNGDGHFDKDWLHREWRAFQAGMASAAQLDGGKGETHA